MKCTIIGAGRLGKNIALALSTTQLIASFSVCNRSLESAQSACQELGFGHAVNQIEQLHTADIVWICCNDDAIPDVVVRLAQSSCLKQGCFVIHSSGVLSSALLAPLSALGCFVASFHPLKAFKTNYLEATAFHQVDCVLEGDLEVCRWLTASFTQLRATLIAIQHEAKALYHAAACMASNYLITLASCSEELFLKAGIDAEQSRKMMVHLMQGNLTNLLQTKNISDSLTGPLVRGDVNTIALHLNAIENPDIKCLYQQAALSTLALTQLPDELKGKIKTLCCF
ncbi:MAG: Rossmann-like and DUF2520 domain-containing protein [Legionella sp.]